MLPSKDKTTIVITGCGMASSLGLDVANACAAARAGFVRSKSMDFYPVRSSADGMVSGVVCHPVPFLTEGFEGEARLSRLVQGGLEDLTRQCPDSFWEGRCVELYLSVPNLNRLTMGADLVPDEDISDGMREEEKKPTSAEEGMEFAKRLLNNGARMARWRGPVEPIWSTESGHTGVAEAIEQASLSLRAGRCDLAIVGGVDSYLDGDTLAWLENSGRLKTPELASGLQPGEACGFLLFETEENASKRQTGIQLRLATICLERESQTLLSGKRSTGFAMAEVIQRAANASNLDEEIQMLLIHDLNGEIYRAQEWGLALMRLTGASKAFVGAEILYHSVSFGTTGSATGIVQTCIAKRIFERSNRFAKSIGLVSGGDGPMRSCIVLERL